MNKLVTTDDGQNRLVHTLPDNRNINISNNMYNPIRFAGRDELISINQHGVKLYDLSDQSLR